MTPEAAETIRSTADVVQWINLGAALAILVLSLAAGRRWPGWRPYLIGPGTWGAHSVVFYAFALSGALNGPVASLWSAVRVLHISLVVLALLLAAVAVVLSPTLPGEYGDEAGE